MLDEIVEAFSQEDARVDPVTSEWQFNELAPGIVLVISWVNARGRTSRRSSIWQVFDRELVLRFHQGMIVKE